MRTPPPRGATFDADAVVRVLKFFRLLQHISGRFAGVDFRLLDWQVEFLIAPVFGWKNSDGFRVVRTVWFEIPRKNGKSSIASGLGLYLLCADREAGAEVYAAAGDRSQARIVFRAAKMMAGGAPKLREKLNLFQHLIETKDSGCIFRALSSDGDRQHGLNVHGAIIDEVHVHKNRDLVDALETGTGSRSQPLVAFITTADAGDQHSIYAEKRAYVEMVSAKTVTDPAFYGVVFGAQESDDPFAPKTIANANPGAGITVQREYLERVAGEARTSPGALNRYLRLHLNIRTRSQSAWFAPEVWDEGAGLVCESYLLGRDCFAGLDLASTSDYNAWVLVFPGDDAEVDPVRILARFWLPRAAVNRRKELRTTLEDWEKQGFIFVTDGDVQDQHAIREQISKDAEQFNIRGVAFDGWNSGFMPELVEQGLPGWSLPQTTTQLNKPSKLLERLVGERRLQHGGNPVLRWMAGNVQLFTDSGGNIKPDRKKSFEKIDGIAALVDALAAWQQGEPVVVDVSANVW